MKITRAPGAIEPANTLSTRICGQRTILSHHIPDPLRERLVQHRQHCAQAMHLLRGVARLCWDGTLPSAEQLAQHATACRCLWEKGDATLQRWVREDHTFWNIVADSWNGLRTAAKLLRRVSEHLARRETAPPALLHRLHTVLDEHRLHTFDEKSAAPPVYFTASTPLSGLAHGFVNALDHIGARWTLAAPRCLRAWTDIEYPHRLANFRADPHRFPLHCLTQLQDDPILWSAVFLLDWDFSPTEDYLDFEMPRAPHSAAPATAHLRALSAPNAVDEEIRTTGWPLPLPDLANAPDLTWEFSVRVLQTA